MSGKLSVRKRIQRKADKPWGKQILTNSTSKQLHEIKRFSKNKSYTNNNNDTLGGVGNTLSDGILHGKKKKEPMLARDESRYNKHQFMHTQTQQQTNIALTVFLRVMVESSLYP